MPYLQLMLESVSLDPGAHTALMALVDAEPERETGGILMGRVPQPEQLLITQVSPPGPKARKRRYSFSRDTRFLQKWLDQRAEQSDGAEDYVGEWHVHHALDGPPSRTDRRSLWRIARRANYPTEQPVLLIVEDVAGERRMRLYRFTVEPAKDMAEIALAE